MKAEIIGVGSELLLGQIANTDAQFISQQLSSVGIDVFYHTVVGDNRDRLLRTLQTASERSDIIITTGGLGPTMDDLTKETVAEFLGLEMVMHEPSYSRLKNFFSGRTMTENNIKQAIFPKGATVLANSNGTAPGSIIETDNCAFIVLPGPPIELKPMFIKSVLPYLESRSGEKIFSRVLKIYGIGESAVEEKIKDILLNQSNPTIAPLAGLGEVTLRLTAKADSQNKAADMIKPVEREIRKRLGKAVYGTDNDTLQSVVVNMLINKGATIATAESCTGGLLSNTITNIPGASECFLESCITYSNKAKVRRLGVKETTLEKYGAVSNKTAEEMARGIRASAGSDIGVGITGIAGPGGGSDEKPVGLVYAAVSDNIGTEVMTLMLNGDRMKIKRDTVNRVLNWLRQRLMELS